MKKLKLLILILIISFASISCNQDEQKTSERVEQNAKGKYWLNTNSMVLHNRSCRWFNNTKAGYFTNEIKGRDCGICGGAN